MADFSILDKLTPAATGPTDVERAPVSEKLQRQSEKNAQKNNFALEVYKVYQERTKATEGLQNRILKGLQAGEPIGPILLEALEAVALATDCKPFYEQARQAFEQNYKEGNE